MTKTKRIKRVLAQIRTREEASEAMDRLAAAANTIVTLNAERDAEILELNKRYDPRLNAQTDIQDAETDALKAWAEAHPEHFTKKKSLELLSGTLGFRTGTPSLKPINKFYTWAKIFAIINTHLPGFIRIKKEVDKELLIAQRDMLLASPCALLPSATPVKLSELLPHLGLKIVQEETFYVEPRLTEIETRQTVKA